MKCEGSFSGVGEVLLSKFQWSKNADCFKKRSDKMNEEGDSITLTNPMKGVWWACVHALPLHLNVCIGCSLPFWCWHGKNPEWISTLGKGRAFSLVSFSAWLTHKHSDFPKRLLLLFCKERLLFVFPKDGKHGFTHSTYLATVMGYTTAVTKWKIT